MLRMIITVGQPVLDTLSICVLLESILENFTFKSTLKSLGLSRVVKSYFTSRESHRDKVFFREWSGRESENNSQSLSISLSKRIRILMEASVFFSVIILANFEPSFP